MKGKPYRAEKYGRVVWVSPLLEELRSDECLCLNCASLHPGQPTNCPIAQSLFNICVAEGVATPVTRCPQWSPRGQEGA